MLCLKSEILLEHFYNARECGFSLNSDNVFNYFVVLFSLPEMENIVFLEVYMEQETLSANLNNSYYTIIYIFVHSLW